MNSRLYVGNLAFQTTENDLNQLFSNVGTVREATLIMDRTSGSSRGFGFVVMGSDSEAETAINEFNNVDLHGRNLTVNVAREREMRPSGRSDHQNRASRRF